MEFGGVAGMFFSFVSLLLAFFWWVDGEGKRKGAVESEVKKKGYHVGPDDLTETKNIPNKNRSFSPQFVKNMIVDRNTQTTVPPLTMVFTRVN